MDGRLHRKFLYVCFAFLLGCSGSGDPPGQPAAADPPTRNEASRFLAQASFGPTDTEIERVASFGYEAWITDQSTRPTQLHKDNVDARRGELAPLGLSPSEDDFVESFWHSAVSGEDQLRQRMAFALSQIFVVSFADGALFEQVRGIASYYDMLTRNAFGNFRTLLRDVATHPMMGVYLSSLHNQKESPGRVPDENFAREVMQLFSIGLYQLYNDGSVRRDGSGNPIETYDSNDIGGLAQVFTGWSWYAGPSPADQTTERFFGGSLNPDSDWRPMQAYTGANADFHSTSEKRFLGRLIPASTQADPEGDLDAAIDALFMHPNVGPFIGRRLIQRLVTSNPSPAYIARVANAFADNGLGVRGDLQVVLRAVLLDPEARDMPADDLHAGKLREPILRLANFLRAFRSSSGSGRWVGIDRTDDVVSSLGQSPMHAPSVFNFFRPDYAPNQPELAAAALVAPEFQIESEVSVAGYLNYMQGWLTPGTRDVSQDYGPELALAAAPADLVAHLDTLLTGGRMSQGLRQRIEVAVTGRPMDTGDVAAALRDRVAIAIFLTMASPDYLIQR